MPTRSALDSPQRRFAENIVRRIVEQHHIAYFAGGCVRDDLLGIIPADYDIATSATPDQVRAIFGRHRTLFVGAAFGVVCVHERVGEVLYQVEVATFRSDSDYSDGRRPDRVDFTTPERDAQRRDFTVNGLFYDPITDQVIDFVGGQLDLERRLLRAIGDPHARLSEDKLRMLRAVRIAARFGFAIEEKTQLAISAKASEIKIVSPERIAAEMRKMLENPNRSTAVRMLKQFQLLQAVFSELALSFTDSDSFQKTLTRLDAMERPDFVAALAILIFSNVERAESIEQVLSLRPVVAQLKASWRLSNEEAAALEFTLSNLTRFLEADRLKWSVLQPLLVSPYVHHALHFGTAILLADHADLTPIDRCRAALELPKVELNPEPLVDGQLLMSLGLPTGPLYARLIKSGRAAQLDGELRNRDEAAAWVREQSR